MPVYLPNLASEKSCRLVACGLVHSDKKAVLDWLKERRRFIASYKKEKNRHFVRLMTGGRRDRHFHLEIALASWFPKNQQPKAASKISEIQDAIDRISGEKLDLNLSADFSSSLAQLPESGPIRLLSTKTSMAGTSVQLTAGTLDVSGSRINQIQWCLINEDKVMVTLETQVDSSVTAKYLTEAHEMMEKYYRVLVLGQTEAP